MNVFIRNVPEQSSSKQLQDCLRPHLETCGIKIFHCDKFKNKPLAQLTVLDEVGGQNFLQRYGDTALRSSKPDACKCILYGQALRFTVDKKQPDQDLLKHLRKLANDRITASKRNSIVATPCERVERQYSYTSLSCGVWQSSSGGLSYVSHFFHPKKGDLIFGKHSLALLSNTSSESIARYRVDIPYYSVQSITLGDFKCPSMIFTLSEAPKLYGVGREDEAIHTLLNMLQIEARSAPKRKRLSSLGSNHNAIVGSCFVYRVLLTQPSDLQNVGNLLKQAEKLPPGVPHDTPICMPTVPFYFDMARLSQTLATPILSFGIKFQLQRLALNGYLAPARVLKLLPEVTRLFHRIDDNAACVEVLRKFARQIPYAGPEVDSDMFDDESLEELLRDSEAKVVATKSFVLDLTQRHAHLIPVHKAMVTPTGIVLEGPAAESKNRILRKYSSHIDCFLRVSFLDEDGQRLHYDKNVSLEDIYHVRFKGVLDNGIDIAGKRFEFLGFSHSSLREQTCWFMAPFLQETEQLNARGVIAALGDFSSIRSPAKCAARIGQAFSETNGTVKLTLGSVRHVEDVQRNGRVFSDGVGTFSPEILKKVGEQYSSRGNDIPRLLQIRWAGAKGMISLDTRLEGELLLVRQSMIKFESPDRGEIEICGSASSLPMNLNRQFIKIMEDLGVDPKIFMELQAIEVEKLRQTTENPRKAAKFLEHARICQSSKTPWLLRKLSWMNLDPLADPFLRGMVELATLMQLRELKYRARIPVENGVTLYGIMDETDTLEEGQIYCRTDKFVVTGRVAVTRAPALHPGDIQFADCVDVLDDSPLNALHNCVVFSQRGARDLPSQLSGGDLDGDLYNIIWDDRLLPEFTELAADYPRVAALDIARPVERKDMTDFFIQFMENDQLGRIATLHQQLADYHPEGTRDSQCLLLAEMHSTAVDFSKTGIPVDISKLPRYKSYRPDFMATGPRCHIEKGGVTAFIEENALGVEEEDDLISRLDPESTQMKYYESDRVLGRLFRAINEVEFLEDLKRLSSRHKSGRVLDKIWKYVSQQTQLIQWQEYKREARDIREAYETVFIDTMYQFSPSSTPLTEIEVFVGSVLGKNAGIPNKRLRKAAIDMKEKFNRDVEYTINCIVNGLDDEEDERDEALARSIACLAVAIEERSSKHTRMDEKVQSFAYVAAAVCLKEIELFLIGARRERTT